MDLQVETTARALAFRHGALTVAEIVAWADCLPYAGHGPSMRSFMPAFDLAAAGIAGDLESAKAYLHANME